MGVPFVVSTTTQKGPSTMDAQQQDVAEVESVVLGAQREQQAEAFKALRTKQYAEFDYLSDWLTGDQDTQMQVAREDALNHLIEGTQVVMNGAWLVGLIDYCSALKEVKEATSPASTDERVAELIDTTVEVLSTFSMKDTKKEMLDRIAKVQEILKGVLTT